jgi:hypothetical protein
VAAYSYLPCEVAAERKIIPYKSGWQLRDSLSLYSFVVGDTIVSLGCWVQSGVA